MNDIINPHTNEPVSKKAAETIRQAREARAGARKAARSGNPAKRIPALKALIEIPAFIQAVYIQDFRNREATQ